jgi:hypothetical protein
VGQVSEFCGQADVVQQKECSGGQIAMRISFANFSFFMLNALLTLCMTHEGDVRVHLHTSAWALKILVWVGALFGFFFVPSNVIYGYAQVRAPEVCMVALGTVSHRNDAQQT